MKNTGISRLTKNAATRPIAAEIAFIERHRLTGEFTLTASSLTTPFDHSSHIVIKATFKDGKLHRKDGPAWKETECSQLSREAWARNGLVHTIISYSEDKSIKRAVLDPKTKKYRRTRLETRAALG